MAIAKPARKVAFLAGWPSLVSKLGPAGGLGEVANRKTGLAGQRL
jgi:hypothetical protein